MRRESALLKHPGMFQRKLLGHLHEPRPARTPWLIRAFHGILDDWLIDVLHGLGTACHVRHAYPSGLDSACLTLPGGVHQSMAFGLILLSNSLCLLAVVTRQGLLTQ